MPPKKKKGEKKKRKYVYETYLEPICECSKCGNIHLRSERIRHVPKDTSEYLCIYLCPKCKGKPYMYIGDQEIRKRKKNDES
jgi:hypothetical protein